MDRNFYYQKIADQHQRAVSKELATRHLLHEAEANPRAASRGKHVALRIAPAMILIAALLWLHFSG
jgi:hypothetical protein